MRRNHVTILLVSLLATSFPVPPAAAAPSCFGRAATIVGTDDDDEITGTPGRDVIYAGKGRDEVHAGGGKDLVCGAGAIDLLYGEGGNDRLEGGPGYVDDWLFGGGGADRLLPGCNGPEGDLMEGGAGPDRLLGNPCGSASMVPGPGDDFVRAIRGEVTFPHASGPIDADLTEGVVTGEGRDVIEVVRRDPGSDDRLVTVVGTDFDDRLVGGPLPDSFQGRGGDDVIEGRGGADFLDPNTGADTISGGGGDDLVVVYDGTVAAGGPGDDAVLCEPRFERQGATFDGGAGSDWVSFFGLPGEGVVDLGAGTATCSFTYESSLPPTTVVMELALESVENVESDRARLDVTGSAERNVLRGGSGGDVLRGAGGNDEIDGDNGSDEIRGGDGDDRLLGGTWGDELFGDAGDDFLDGEEGPDSVDGGEGRDECSGETRTACEDS